MKLVSSLKPTVHTKKARYRIKVYAMPDGSSELIYNDDPAPEGGRLVADQEILQITTVTEHPVP